MLKIIDFLTKSEYDFRIGWLSKGEYAKIYFSQSRVVLNLTLMISDAIIHEFFHYEYPHKSEAEVEKLTRNKIKRMKVDELKEIANVFILLTRKVRYD